MNKLFRKYGNIIYNLNYAKSIRVDKNWIFINMITDRESIFGFSFWISGGGDRETRIKFETEELANQEFNNIKNILKIKQNETHDK